MPKIAVVRHVVWVFEVFEAVPYIINDLLSLSAARTIHAERRMADVLKVMSPGCNTRWQTVVLLF